MSEKPGIKNYVLPKYFTCKGNLKARWYIQFHALNTDSGKLQLKRIVCPAKYQTKKQRDIWGKENCIQISKLLEKGFCFGTPKVEPVEIKVEDSPAELIEELTKTLDALKPTLRPKSTITYYSALNKLEPYANKLSTSLLIGQFGSNETILFRDYLMNDLKNSPRTANNTIEHLNTIYTHLRTRASKLPESPFKIKKLKEEVTTKNIAFTDKDKHIVENYMIQHEPELYLFTRLMYYAFIRPGELHQLILSDFKIAEQYILIRGAISKNGKTETVQIIPPLMKELLKASNEDQKQFYYFFGKGLVPSKYMTAKEVAFRRHQKVLKHLGLLEDGYTLYSWKHTGAVNAYRAGVGVKELQKLLRHSSISVTDIYLKSLGLRTDPNIQNYNW